MEEGENIVKVVEVLGGFALKLTIEEKSNYKKKSNYKSIYKYRFGVVSQREKEIESLERF